MCWHFSICDHMCWHGAINYVCSGCRAGRSVQSGDSENDVANPPNDSSAATSQETQPALLQLIMQVQSIATSLKGVMEQVSQLKVQGNRAETAGSVRRNESTTESTPPSQGIQPQVSEEMLRSVREVNEREKRKHSVVLRGLGVATTEEVIAKFGEISSFLNIGSVAISDVVRINENLFRGTIGNVEDRMKLLTESNKLKGTVYDSVYIQRDLTYMQRQQVIASRRSREAQARPILTGGNAVRSTNSRTFFPSVGSGVSAVVANGVRGRGRGSGAGGSVLPRGGSTQRGRSSSRGGHVQYSSPSSTNARHIRRDDVFYSSGFSNSSWRGTEYCNS